MERGEKNGVKNLRIIEQVTLPLTLILPLTLLLTLPLTLTRRHSPRCHQVVSSSLTRSWPPR